MTGIRWYDDYDKRRRRIIIDLDYDNIADTKLDQFDRALMNEPTENSDTPMADTILKLQTLIFRMEQQRKNPCST